MINRIGIKIIWEKFLIYIIIINGKWINKIWLINQYN